MQCHISPCSLFSLILLLLLSYFHCPLAFSHVITMSYNLFPLCHVGMIYLTVVIIWHSFVVCCVNLFHVVSPSLTHSLDVSGILFVFPDKFWPHMHCKRGSVGQSERLLIPRSSVRFRINSKNSNSHGFELHRPSIKGTKLLLKVINAIVIIGTNM